MMFGRRTKLGAVLVSLAVLYQWYCPQVDVVRRISRSWDEIIVRPLRLPSRIAVGVNANLDLVVSAVDLLHALNVTPGPVGDFPSITSTSQLEAVVGYSMKHCAGIERVFQDKLVFQETVNAALTLQHSFHVGGNAALIASKMHQLHQNAEVMLVGPIGTKLREVLHPSIATPSYSPHSSDEIHVILEYASGETWASVTSSCANRVIYSHDEANSKMLSLEVFRDSVESFRPDLVILSGAHLLEGESRKFWQQRLKDIAETLDDMPRTVPVHWELATVGDLSFFHDLADTLFPRIDSLGLNEQELISAAKSHNASFDSTTGSSTPTVAWIADLLDWLLRKYSSRPRLTRVHFHSLTFHIVATVKGGPWSNSASSVAAGAKIAGLQACDTIDFSAADKFQVKLPPSLNLVSTYPEATVDRDAVIQWEREEVVYHLAPVVVCRRPLKTVGLGDAISASGLLYSHFTVS